MIPFCNYKNIVRLFVALILFGGISSVTLAEEEYCPPELCDEVLVEVAQEDEYCPPELCDEVLVEAAQENEY